MRPSLLWRNGVLEEFWNTEPCRRNRDGGNRETLSHVNWQMAEESGLEIGQFKTHVKSPTYEAEDGDGDVEHTGNKNTTTQPYPLPLSRKKHPKDLRFAEESTSQRSTAAHKVVHGSYAQSTPSLRHRMLREESSVPYSGVGSSHLSLKQLLKAVDVDPKRYGLEELRDGFFDASFSRPLNRTRDGLTKEAIETFPDPSGKEHHPLSFRRFLPQQLEKVKASIKEIVSSRAGICLLKTFLGFFITYIICLIPASRDWLGRTNYVMVVSAIANHPGRPIGSQLDGAFLTIFGTAAGLGWGSLALYVSTSTVAARLGYGGILATFLVLFTATIGWLRCAFIRLYQAVICAGIAIIYTTLANTSEDVDWMKIYDYGIPWLVGQGVCLIIAVLVFPDAGARPLA